MSSLLKRFKSNYRSIHGAAAERSSLNPYKAGLTLVELIVVMVLSIVLVGSAFMAYLAHSKTGREQHEVASLQQDIRAVIDMIDRDVRNSGCTEPRLAIIAAINGPNSGLNSIALNMDLNLDGDTLDQGEVVRYWLNGTTLERTDQGATTMLAENVTSFGIVYFGLNNTSIVPSGALTQAQANSVLSVQVTLGLHSAKVDPDTGQTVKRLVRRRMQSRNQEIILKAM